MISVILVEDHVLVKEGIEGMLEKEADIQYVAWFPSGETLRTGLSVHAPDVILMDINLPDIEGTNLCKEVKANRPEIKILALSINNQPTTIREMMANGADGYLLKDADRHEIIAGIHAVMQHKNFYSKSAITALKKAKSSELPPLTRREREVLELIAEGLTNKQIASKLFVDVTTVDSHRKNMLSKYGVHNTSALIKLAISAHLLG